MEVKKKSSAATLNRYAAIFHESRGILAAESKGTMIDKKESEASSSKCLFRRT